MVLCCEKTKKGVSCKQMACMSILQTVANDYTIVCNTFLNRQNAVLYV